MRGAPAKAIQELAGHADLTMTQRYMHLSPAALDAAIRLLENRGASWSGLIERSKLWRLYLETGRGSDAKTINESGDKLAVRQGFEPWVQV